MLATYYYEIKLLHITCATLSFVLYTTRGIWMLTGSKWHGSLFARRVPHWNDTLLLALGIVLTTIVHQYPVVDAWLSAKMIGLLVHIGLGFVAFRGALSLRARTVAWIGSLLAFAYVVGVALTRNPWLFG